MSGLGKQVYKPQTLEGLNEENPDYYPFFPSKERYLNLIPEGGNWHHLPEELKSKALGFLGRSLWILPSPLSRTSMPSTGRPRPRPAAAGDGERRDLRHPRGRDRRRQPGRLADHSRALPPGGDGRPAHARRGRATAGRDRHPRRRPAAGGPDRPTPRPRRARRGRASLPRALFPRPLRLRVRRAQRPDVPVAGFPLNAAAGRLRNEKQVCERSRVSEAKSCEVARCFVADLAAAQGGPNRNAIDRSVSCGAHPARL